ncbi:hypothetical protein [Pseudomonas aeruginosa]|uniref:hypothetical protein n=1 Tax=Pseudomonas aeruginosa TaxID=287 RepID=UPI0014956C36|nr:hypothetical protein [Pseudomonas aeruginosa]NPS37551.1 hypothetical protein [Pseudomonas aeruginosa]NPS87270.1 hypothetical protein [Pseudomonas aeruginosa]
MAGRPKGLPKTGGRSKGTPNKATIDVKVLAQQYSEEAVKSLVEIMRDAEAPHAARVAAAKDILDRGHGKATQPIAGDPDLPPVGMAPNLSDDQLTQLARKINEEV